jgi:hypothetical protein
MNIGKNQRHIGLMILLIVNLSATILHYIDNFRFFDKYPAPVWMQPHHVYTAWLMLAPFSVVGYFLYTKRNFWAAYLCLFIYSLTSVGGIAHYFFGSIADFSTKMHIFIWFEELTGWMLLGFILWSSLILKEWRDQTTLQ